MCSMKMKRAVSNSSTLFLKTADKSSAIHPVPYFPEFKINEIKTAKTIPKQELSDYSQCLMGLGQ